MGEIFKQSRHITELSSLLDTVWDSMHQLECIAIHPESLGAEELKCITSPLKAALIQKGLSLKTISEESIIFLFSSYAVKKNLNSSSLLLK